MAITNIPSNADGSAGRDKSDLEQVPDLDHYVPAQEWNTVKRAAVEAASTIGLTASPAAGTIEARLSAVEGGAGVRAVVEALSDTTMADADSGKVIRCSGGGVVTITVNAGLTPGTTVEYVQEGAGQVQVAAGAGMTLRHPATFHPYTAEQFASLTVTILDAAEALVRGDLEAV
ncbi:MAG: hypothetical protein RID81_07210 [Sandaracinaceae bacterium]